MSELKFKYGLKNESGLDQIVIASAKIVSQILKSWKFILAFVGSVTLVFSVFVFLQDREYTASGIVMMTQESEGSIVSKMAGIGIGSLSSLTGLNKSSESDVIEQIAKSRSMALATVKTFRLDTVWKLDSTKIKDEVLVQYWNQKYFFEIGENQEMLFSYQDKSPQRAANILRWFIHRTDSLYVSSKQAQARNVFSYIQSLADEKSIVLRHAEDTLLDFQLQNKDFLPSQKVAIDLKKAAELDAEADMLDVNIRMARESSGPGGSQEASLQSLRQIVREKAAKLESDGGPVTTKNIPSVLRLELQFDRLLRQVEIQGTANKLLIQQLELQRAEVAKVTPTLFYVDSVIVPQKPTSPKRLLLVQLVFSISLLFSIGLILNKERIFEWWSIVRERNED